MEHRIYDKKVSIDTNKVHEFFEKRFIKSNPIASVMLSGNVHDGVAEKRNQNETELLLGLLNYSEPFKILDLGCGLGRLADNLISHIDFYDGIDFTRNYIDVANSKYLDNSNVNFYHMSAVQPNVAILIRKYNLITITALMLYLNDDEIDVMMGSLFKYTKNKSQIYIRESISILHQRLTLKDFHSEELNVDYNAIYRTKIEYENFFLKHLFSQGFKIVTSGLFLKGELVNREETNQMYWLLERV